MENSNALHTGHGTHPFVMNPYYVHDEKDHGFMSMNAAAGYYSQRMTMPPSFPKPLWRKGKWLDEEEAYTKKLIEAFNSGYLNISSGTTLRSFLSERLSCDPMRITKKFAGSSCIGKQVFTPCDPKTVDAEAAARVTAELKELEEKFRAKVDGQRAMEYYQPGAYPGFHPVPLHATRMPYMENVPPEYFAAMSSHPPFQPFVSNPYFMKMYRAPETPYPFMVPPHPNPIPSSELTAEIRSESSQSKPVTPPPSDESKVPVSVKNSPKTIIKKIVSPRPEDNASTKIEPATGSKIDLDASDLLLNFFKVANEAMGRTSRAESIELETAKFESELLPSKESPRSPPPSTVASTTNLVGLVSCSSSDADHDEAPGSPLKLTLKRQDHSDRENYEEINSIFPAKRMKIEC